MVEVHPEIGGKVGQIHDKIISCDLLVPPQRPYRPIPVNGNWLLHDISGMDDCFPNVAAGAYPEAPWMSARLPDLGEWTHTSWRLTKTMETEVAMEAEGHALPYFAIKTIRFVGERTLEFSYRVENRGQSSLRYLWSAHPLIAVQEEYELQLPPGDLKFRVFPMSDGIHRWPVFKGTRLSNEWIPQGTTLKIFVTGLTEGWCALQLPNHTLRFSFDRHTIPAVGIWFNNLGFPSQSERPFRCIAVEPCTTPSDLLDGLEATAYPRIASGGAAAWSVRLNIASPKTEMA